MIQGWSSFGFPGSILTLSSLSLFSAAVYQSRVQPTWVPPQKSHGFPLFPGSGCATAFPFPSSRVRCVAWRMRRSESKSTRSVELVALTRCVAWRMRRSESKSTPSVELVAITRAVHRAEWSRALLLLGRPREVT